MTETFTKTRLHTAYFPLVCRPRWLCFPARATVTKHGQMREPGVSEDVQFQ